MANQKLGVPNQEIIQIPIDGLFAPFQAFLNTEDNNRIFFSGKFGVGKTFFLDRFFANKSEMYDVYHLFPVNYQIYQNEDIFELIKYDILTVLIKKNPEVFKENRLEDFVDLRNLLYVWGKDNWMDISKTLIEHIPRLGKPLKDVISLIEQFNDYTKKVEGGEKLVIDDYLKSVKEKSMDETDQISSLIKEKVVTQKGSTKKSVLILDDLDRVDPEHIFRLLNVFSAYFDKEHNNKFGFDHIILVGDEQNIQSIFHHKYGGETDFQGYFDKFFSLYVYNFNNKAEVLNNLEGLLYKLKNNNELLQPALSRMGYIHLFLLEIFRRAITVAENNKVNLRTIYKGVRHELPSTKTHNGNQQRVRMNESNDNLDTGIKILTQCFGGSTNNLVEVLLQCRESVKNEIVFEEDYFPYNVFSIAMLYKIYGRNKLENRKVRQIIFGEHTIEILDSEDLNKPFIVKDENLLFYDLLTKYIREDLSSQKVRY